MITSVRGQVAALAPDAAVVEVGGVGLAVQCTPATLAALRLGAEARLATSLVVREDSLTLYGFAEDDERVVFELLQTAGGVGPRLAQAALATLTPDALRLAFSTGDEKALTAVPGIGKKVAQRLLLELKDRLGAPSGRVSAAGASGGRRVVATGPAPWREALTEALVGLGYSSTDAAPAVEAAGEGLPADADPDLATLLRTALRGLNRAR